MEKIEFKTENPWSNKPNGDGLYKIKLKDGEIEFAVILGDGERSRIKPLKSLWDSEPIHHPIYKKALFLGPLIPSITEGLLNKF
ncbi:hypothetical protein EBU94_02025 [bacterium]|nr:hypothetical protein [bacterium]